MAKKKQVEAEVVYKPSSSWRGRLILVGLVLAAIASALGFIFQDDVISAKDSVIQRVGLGVAPIAVWGAAFAFALTKHQRWLLKWQLWLGSIAGVALSIGILDFFEYSTGYIAFFTNSGEVALGGEAGSRIVGNTAWMGSVRLVGIFVIGVGIVAPPFAADVSVSLGKMLLSAAMAVAIALKRFSRIYRFERKSAPQPQLEMASGAASAVDYSDEADSSLSPYARIITSHGDSERGRQNYGSVVTPSKYEPRVEVGQPEILPYGTSKSQDDDLYYEDDEIEVSEPYAKPGTPIHQLTDKYNNLWQAESTSDDTDDDEDDEPEYIEGSADRWTQPPLDLLLDIEEGGITEEQMLSTAANIKRTLSEYGVEVEIGQIQPGPAVTMYGLIPGWVRRTKQVRPKDENGRPILDETGRPIVKQEVTKTRVKVDSVLSREKDLSLTLKTPSIRIETPVMGKSQIGIEVPNPEPSLVTLRSVMKTPEFKKFAQKAPLPVALGKGSGGETVLIDLAKMPHLLIAGATGSGKSVCLNTIVSCLTVEKTPDELRLLLIDPKRVELTPYNGVPHLLSPVVVDTDKVVGLLKGVIREMFDRYRRMEGVGVRNIDSYNKKVAEAMPYLVVVVDELADLMMSAAFDVEQSLCRLAQLGRATGIHLIVATQRPSVDVVTGLIKANFPSRISFGVTSQVDSRTILDSAGAEKLLGRGDMLYSPIDATRPSRVQGVFISDKEIENLVQFWKFTPWARLPIINLHPLPDDDPNSGGLPVGDGADELMDKAIDLARTHNKLSTSLLQRRLRIGYPRAARLMDELEEQGVVGPSDGSKSRDVIMNQG